MQVVNKKRTHLFAALALGFLAWASPVPAQASSAHRVELLTIGPDASTFGRFGHAVICVFESRRSAGRCYNYGAARARDGLARDVLLGEAVFLVKPESYSFVVDYYRRRGREIRTQTLRVSPAEFSRLASILADDAQPHRREYRYDPFRDNCSTRIRDAINQATNGRLRAATKGRRSASTYRNKVRDAVHDQSWALAGLDLLMGGRGDHKLNEWDAMFEPAALQAAIERAFGATPKTLMRGKFSTTQATWLAGRWPLFLAAPCLFLIGAWTGRRGAKVRAAGFGLLGLVVSCLSLALVTFALSSRLSEAGCNSALLAVVPTDALIVLAALWTTNARNGWSNTLRRYLQLRLLLLAALLAAVGLSWARPSLLPILALAGGVIGGVLVGLGGGSWRAGTTPSRHPRRPRRKRHKRVARAGR